MLIGKRVGLTTVILPGGRQRGLAEKSSPILPNAGETFLHNSPVLSGDQGKGGSAFETTVDGGKAGAKPQLVLVDFVRALARHQALIDHEAWKVADDKQER